MPNPSSIAGELLARLTATAVEQSVALDRGRKYSLAHLGVDSSGQVSTDSIHISITQAVSPDAAAGLDKAEIPDKGTVSVGPGATTLKFRTAAGEASLQVISEN